MPQVEITQKTAIFFKYKGHGEGHKAIKKLFWA